MNFDFKLQPGRELNVLGYEKYKKVISIVTPAWNPKDYILQTANCVLNQTYPYFEWLIIDDGSTNKDSLKLLNKVEKMDSRIKVIHKENGGASVARDYGVSKTDKDVEYIVFLDDDDLIDKTFLECAYFSMCANSDASWCYTDVVNFDGQEFLWSKLFSSKGMKKENVLVNCAMIKKEAFLEVEGFKLDGKGLWEDWILWLKLLAKGHFPIHMSYYGFWYRKKKEGSELSKASSKENYNNNMKMIKSYADKIIEDVIPIQFPRYTYKWDGISEVNEDFIVPSFKKSKKTNILVIVPWMTLGGADKFNLDLFKLINKDKYSITLVTTQPTQYIWRQEFEEHCDAVYDLSSFIDHKDWVAFMNYIIESRGIDIIFNTNSVSGYMMLPYLKAKHPDIPIMDYIHMEEWYNRNGGYSRDSAAVSSVIDRTLFCNGGSQKIMNEYFGIDKEKLNTVYIGVDAEKFDPSKYDKEALRKKYELSSEQFVIGLIARIDYQKRPYLLMRIIEETVKSGKIKNPLFLVAGGGPLLDDIKKIAKTKKLENFVKFLGVSKTPDEIYAVSDVTLNCSIKEGLALTAYESLSMGVPVVSCDVGGQKELINEQTGVIVPCLQDEKDIYDFDYSKEDVNNYVVGLEKIYSNLDKYKSKCRKRILESFTIQNMVVNMEKEFDALLKIKKDYNFLSNNVDIYKELLNEYFLAVEKEYFWLCIDYYQKNYGVDLVKYNDSINNTRSKRRNSLNIREKLWQIGAWRWFVKTPIWKLGRKIVKGK